MKYLINMPIGTKDIAIAIDGLEIEEFKFKVEAIKGFKITAIEEHDEYDKSYRALKDYLKNKVGGGVFFNVEIVD